MGRNAARERRRMELARAVVEGKPIAAVAREVKISRTWASKEANSTETRVLIAEILDKHRARIVKLLARAIGVLEEGMKAKKVVALPAKNKAGQAIGIAVDLGPDTYARQSAVKRLIDLVTAGRGTPASDTEAATRRFTYEEFKILLTEHPRPK